MSWTAPSGHVYATGEVVLASVLNTYIKDDLAFLGGSDSALVATTQTTASLTYTDLVTVGPAVTLLTGTRVIILLNTIFTSNTAGDGAYMSVAVSGATTLAAADTNANGCQNTGTNTLQSGNASLLAGLTAGNNTFTAKYRALTGGTATFGNRSLAVIPLTT